MQNKRFFTTRKEVRFGYGAYDEFHEVEVDLAELLAKERYEYLHETLNALEVGQRIDGGCYYDTIIRLKDAE